MEIQLIAKRESTGTHVNQDKSFKTRKIFKLVLVYRHFAINYWHLSFPSIP